MGLTSEVLRDWASLLMGPSAFAIIVATIVAFSLPVLLHIYIHHVKTSDVTSLPTFLLLGPSGAGKTALITQVRFVAWSNDSLHRVAARAYLCTHSSSEEAKP